MDYTELRILLAGLVTDAKNVWFIAGLHGRATKRPNIGFTPAIRGGGVSSGDYDHIARHQNGTIK
jgi:hypothetical protein